ncbi:MAG: HAMP domain-containing histidine kinase, partial [Clostridia bacterium]|nr:HAMP domain-containing histidine kinase [Clostridia bacterium]
AGSGELVVGENTDAAATEAAKTWFSSYFDCLTALTAYTSRPLIVNAEEILAEVEASYRNEYSDALATLTASYAEVQDKIDKMTSVRFICRDTRTGAVYSNVGANSVTPDALGELRRGSELDLDVDAAGASVRIGTDDLSGEYARTAFQSLGAELYLTVAPSYISSDPYSNYFYCYELCSRNLTLWCVILAVSVVLFLADGALLCSSAGVVDGSGVRPLPSDKIYKDIQFVFTAAACVAIYMVYSGVSKLEFFGRFSGASGGVQAYCVGLGICFTLSSLFVLRFACSMTRSIRLGGDYLKTLVGVAARKLAAVARDFCRGVAESLDLRDRTIKVRFALWVTVKLICDLVLTGVTAVFFANSQKVPGCICAAALVIENIVSASFAYNAVDSVQRLARVAREMKMGEFKSDPSFSDVSPALREFSDDLMNAREGLRTALDTAVRGERLKSELITNVSHDLKTPLTSVISYADLLKRRDIGDETARGYIDIIGEKAQRIKTLIENLTEVSKISSGNVELDIVKLDLNELAIQFLYEYEDEFESIGLSLRLAEREEPLIVDADSRQTARIIENLISNVRKYAMTGTRVYTGVEERGGFGCFYVKNVCREEQTVSAENLTERFVMGDNSRTGGESSGLGLSIVKNLCELQNGRFEVSIDGDVFTAEVLLPRSREDQDAV